jgi:hypothetical protein
MKRAIFIGLVAAMPLGACGSDGTANGGGSGAGAIGSYQSPPANPQAALDNPEQPPPNGSAPPGNDQAPPPNPQAPGGPGGSVNTCSSICAGTGVCEGLCQNRCALGSAVEQCAGPVSSFVQCIQTITFSLVCDDRGRLGVPDGMGCRDEWRDAAECLGLDGRSIDIVDPPPPNGNDNRGRGRMNDAGLPPP